MRLKDVARRFEKVDVYDGYTNALLTFKCQSSGFDDHSSIGATARRRVMSVDPAVTIPARKVVKVLGDTWIIGDKNLDGYFTSEIRAGYNLRKSSGLYTLLTPGQACLDSAGTAAHAYLEFAKDIQDQLNTADVSAYWRGFFSNTETLSSGTVFKSGTAYYRIRTAYATPDRFTLAEADTLGTARVAVSVLTSTYNIATDSDTTTGVSTYGLLFEYAKAYIRDNPALSQQEAGDMLLLVAKSAVTPTVASTLSIGGETYRIKAVASELDAWLLHVRPV